MELQSTMVILALCLLSQPFAEAGMRHPRQDHKPRRAPKSSSTTTAAPDGGADAKPENEIKYDPIQVRYQVHQYPNLSAGDQNKQAGRSPGSNNLPHVTQQQQGHLQQVHMQQPLLHLPAAAPQLHPFHQQQIIQMIQRALFATQRHNQPTAMIIIAQPAASQQAPPQPSQLPVHNGLYAGQTQPLLNYYQQDNQQAKYQLVQETVPQHLQYIAESNLPHPAPQNYQIIPASALQYQPDYAVPTTHMSAVQPQQKYPHQLSQIASLAQLTAQQYPGPAQQYPGPAQQYPSPAQQYAGPVQQYSSPAQQYPGPAQQYPNPAQQYSSSVQEYLSPAQAQAYTRHAPEHLGSAHQFQFEAGSRAAGQSGGDGQVGVPVRSLPPIITGFENFSAEQQEKIKEQLSAHFGAPLKLLAEQSDRGQHVVANNHGGFVPSQLVDEGRSGRSSSSSIMNLTKNKSQKM